MPLYLYNDVLLAYGQQLVSTEDFCCGACCVDGNCVGNLPKCECDNSSGSWHGDQDCADPEFECPSSSSSSSSSYSSSSSNCGYGACCYTNFIDGAYECQVLYDEPLSAGPNRKTAAELCNYQFEDHVVGFYPCKTCEEIYCSSSASCTTDFGACCRKPNDGGDGCNPACDPGYICRNGDCVGLMQLPPNSRLALTDDWTCEDVYAEPGRTAEEMCDYLYGSGGDYITEFYACKSCSEITCGSKQSSSSSSSYSSSSSIRAGWVCKPMWVCTPSSSSSGSGCQKNSDCDTCKPPAIEAGKDDSGQLICCVPAAIPTTEKPTPPGRAPAPDGCTVTYLGYAFVPSLNLKTCAYEYSNCDDSTYDGIYGMPIDPIVPGLCCDGLCVNPQEDDGCCSYTDPNALPFIVTVTEDLTQDECRHRGGTIDMCAKACPKRPDLGMPDDYCIHKKLECTTHVCVQGQDGTYSCEEAITVPGVTPVQTAQECADNCDPDTGPKNIAAIKMRENMQMATPLQNNTDTLMFTYSQGAIYICDD